MWLWLPFFISVWSVTAGASKRLALRACAVTAARGAHNYLFFHPRINSPSPVFECTLSLKLLSISKRTHSACEVPLVQNNKAVHHGKKLWNTTLSPSPFSTHKDTHLYTQTHRHTRYPFLLCTFFTFFDARPLFLPRHLKPYHFCLLVCCKTHIMVQHICVQLSFYLLKFADWRKMWQIL